MKIRDFTLRRFPLRYGGDRLRGLISSVPRDRGPVRGTAGSGSTGSPVMRPGKVAIHASRSLDYSHRQVAVTAP